MKICFFIFIVLCNLNLYSQDRRSDTIDITHIDVSLDMRRILTNQKEISGVAKITLKAKDFAVSYVRFDLLGFKIDSVVQNSTKVNYNYNDTLLYIILSKSLIKTDTDIINIYYHGQPKGDASGWGGFYFIPPYVYNLGVGFAANPHPYGRCWFPCFDNFVERQFFTFHILTDTLDMAVCNGLLVNKDTILNSYLWHYKLNNPIPSYLANVSVAPYTPIIKSYQSLSGYNIPVWLSGIKSDTNNLNKSFINLDQCIRSFEKSFGDYPFERVGYCLVPFNSGAMEHASNISYPRYAADGSLTYEKLYAHELSHHWWGNHTTCKNQEDMWLNEGWASYSESVFLESVYGYNEYKKNVLNNHAFVLQRAHIDDNDYRAVSGVSHAYTYGTTVYKKGADIIHSLRGYMGKDSFFNACKEFQKKYSFSDVTSEDLKTIFQKYTHQNLNSFFRNWVYSPGFAHFEIKNLKIESNINGQYIVQGTIFQKILYANSYYDSVPIEITCKGLNNTEFTQTFLVSGLFTNFKMIPVPFKPEVVMIDFNEKLSDAITDEYSYIDSIKTYKYNHARATINVKSISKFQQNFLRVEHHWLGADNKVNLSNVYLSPTHYWSLYKVSDTFFDAEMSLNYLGKSDANGLMGLDSNLFNGTEDSLILLYRENSDSPWVEYSDYIKNMGNKTDYKGNIVVKHVKSGDYSFASKNIKLNSESYIIESNKIVKSFYPNPSNGFVTLELNSKFKNGLIEIYSNNGKLIKQYNHVSDSIQISLTELSKGIYYVLVKENELNKSESIKWIIE